jgi:voltage-gated potassium channel
MPHRVGAQQMERMISRPTTADLVELFAEASHLEMELDEFRVSSASTLVGTTLADSNIKGQFNLLVIGIKNQQGDFRFNPPPHETIGDQDTILVIGQLDDINRMKLAHQI